jgi:hypothetical protein
MVAAFVAGVMQLFVARFAAGDIYPPYSSLRADPFGTKALYESLERIPGDIVARNMKPIESLAGAQGVVLYTGLDPFSFRGSSVKSLDQFEAILRRGARLILSFDPVSHADDSKMEAPVERRWGLRISAQKLRKEGDDEQYLPHETAVYFDRLDGSWRMLKTAAGKPTVIERSFGGGSIALVANGYLLSNEAMLENRDTAMLADLFNQSIDGPRRFTFDEYHFGIEQTGSVAALARQYGLNGALAALALLFALFVWRSSASFLPPRKVAETQVLGKSAVSGFVNLLRRGVGTAGLLPLCVKEWRRSITLGPCCSNDKLKQVDELAANSADPLAGYRQIGRILTAKKIQ